MTWLPLKPLSAPPSITARCAPVTLAGNLPNGKTRAAMSLVVRAGLLEGGADFCVAGIDFAVLVGAGEHAGMISLRAAGPYDYRWGKPGGAKSVGIVMVRLAWPEDVVPSRQRAVPVEFDHDAGWLEVTLPAWARPAQAVAPISPATLVAANQARTNAGLAPLAVEVPKQGYTSLASRVPDPAAADRVRQREGRA
jgi:hypothetical protein